MNVVGFAGPNPKWPDGDALYGVEDTEDGIEWTAEECAVAALGWRAVEFRSAEDRARFIVGLELYVEERVREALGK